MTRYLELKPNTDDHKTHICVANCQEVQLISGLSNKTFSPVGFSRNLCYKYTYHLTTHKKAVVEEVEYVNIRRKPNMLMYGIPTSKSFTLNML